MKNETMAAKLAELFGIDPSLAEKSHAVKAEKKPEKPKNTTRNIGVDELETQSFRAGEGLYYFLIAPELFSTVICKNCNEAFLVSRRNVAHCSSTCLRESLRKLGIEWSRYGDWEGIARDVYGGNEPLIIKNPERIRAILDNPIDSHELAKRGINTTENGTTSA